ncbi:hypothetical protein Pelo_1858 [Pelomyxa schiedti]|nr:hypothetical protein Pelo_1858 [Pelomyxa schiedti]
MNHSAGTATATSASATASATTSNSSVGGPLPQCSLYYHYRDLEGAMFGPFSFAHMYHWWMAGHLDPKVQVRVVGETEFTPIAERPEFPAKEVYTIVLPSTVVEVTEPSAK